MILIEFKATINWILTIMILSYLSISNLYTYDIFQRHCFGNYYDILKEMSYNPKMGEQFGYVMSTSTRFRYDKEGDFV